MGGRGPLEKLKRATAVLLCDRWDGFTLIGPSGPHRTTLELRLPPADGPRVS